MSRDTKIKIIRYLGICWPSNNVHVVWWVSIHSIDILSSTDRFHIVMILKISLGNLKFGFWSRDTSMSKIYASLKYQGPRHNKGFPITYIGVIWSATFT